MSEKFGTAAPGNEEPSIDPIAFSEEMIFGLDPAVHWVNFNNQREQFPEIVAEIAKHWTDRDWFVKLIERLGYNDGIYDATANPTGVFARPFHIKSHKGHEPGLHTLHFIGLRAAGVTFEKCAGVFRTATGSINHNIAEEPLRQIAAHRKQLIAAGRKK